MKYFQKTNIFRDETFSDKNFSGETISRKGDGHHRLWSWSGASTITITISGKPTYQRNISQVTHTGDEKIKADSENSNEAGLSGFACYPDCSKSDKSVNKIKKIDHFQNRQEKLWLCIFLLFAYKSEVNPDCKMKCTIVQVPIYNAYNHHYFSWLQGSDAEMFDLEETLFLPNPTSTAFRTKY